MNNQVNQRYAWTMVKTKVFLAGLLIVAALALAACSKDEPGVQGDPTADPEQPRVDYSYNNEPVTLTFYSQNASVGNENELDELVTKVIKDKYPNITPQLVRGNIEELISGGVIPDIVLTAASFVPRFYQLNLYSDLSGFIKQENIDWNRFDSEVVRMTQGFSDDGAIVGMPFAMSPGLMLVNKDIFDRFGVDYPRDGMTWSEVLELSARVTREDQGTQYIGIDIQGPTIMTRQAGLPILDDKEEKVVLQTEGYRNVFSLMEKFYQIPGIVAPNRHTYDINHFFRNQVIAMFPYRLIPTTTRLPQFGDTLNWDVVSFPAVDDKPGYGRTLDIQLALVAPASPNKNAALAVIKELVGDEAQRAMNRGMRMTVLSDPALKLEVAADTKLYEGKNLQGVFSVQHSPEPKVTVYDREFFPFLDEAAKQMAMEKKDVNTVLREAEEKANLHFQQLLSR